MARISNPKNTLIIFLFFRCIVSTYAQLTVDAGNNKSICMGDTATIGGFPTATGGTPPYNYTWIPNIGLNNNTAANPIASPSASTTYTLTVTDALSNSQTDIITVLLPNIDAGNDTTINEGATILLNASGGYNYKWQADSSLKYIKYAPPQTVQVEPKNTTTYYVTASDSSKTCYSLDSITVFVIPDQKVVFYNTFTPNDDNFNDEWYIGNIEKYPNNHLEIYNRYGKKVFETDGYKNTWGGMSFGEKLPAATYFYILDLGNGQNIYHGTVNIVD